MNRELLRRIFAIIALVGIVGVTVFGTLVFFNLFTDYGILFGVLAVAFACVTAVFFILAYLIRPMHTDLGKPEDADDDDERSGDTDVAAERDSGVAGGQAGDGEGDIDDGSDIEDDGVSDEERKAEQD